jgi:hypothetical protein
VDIPARDSPEDDKDGRKAGGEFYYRYLRKAFKGIA